MDFGIHESFASRIIRKIEDIWIHFGKFELPKKLSNRVDERVNSRVFIVHVTETSIERPKKPKIRLQWQEKTTHLKNAGYRPLANGLDT